MGDSSHVSVHVLTTPLRRPWRAATFPIRIARVLREDDTVPFFLCGRSSAGRGVRNISRSLSATRIVVLVQWTSAEAANAGRAALDDRSRRGGATAWSACLRPLHSRGTWDDQKPFRATEGHPRADGLIASLTCARVRPQHMIDFYLKSFPALARQASRRESPMIAGLGFGGSMPLRDAFTISVWPSAHAVDEYAFHGSPHDAVRRKATEQKWLSQSLFARFVVTDHGGTWAGVDPLDAM